MTEEEMMKNINSKTVDYEQFGRNIRLLRENEGLTLEDVSLMLGYKTPSVVAKWEKGATKPPADAIIKLGLMFGISSEFLLTESVENKISVIPTVLPRDPEYFADQRGVNVKCCPCCGKPLDVNGNDGRFCKYCGQQIAGKEEYGNNVKSLKGEVIERKRKFKWDWY